ncbi:hypothetical protein N7457_009184 [Penicillium paradoxum]|uniref:uncharacterized protein n=1 Tax=Penicillium paradoxum TaxID=176176 RepID=UPI0025476CE2|nr:uncharacterized protein N7457_009184 [Penicillium paradoxum]KAJ5774288.1 hypothetical protein N7457_009184 [Penicillium paradoxum]
MSYSLSSQHFDAVQISTDQEDSKLGLLSQPDTSHIALSSPPSPFSFRDWAAWASQPVYSSRQCVEYGEPYGLGPLPQEPMEDPNGYQDLYRSYVTHPMAGTSMEALAPLAVDAPSEWALLDSSHAFKDQQYSYPVHLNPLQPPQNSPPSPLSEVSSYHSPQSFADASPAMTIHTTDRPSPRSSTGDHKEDRSSNQPYSSLIYDALKAAPGNKLPLQGIYSWFEANTDKGADPKAKGWQNSIRHNLSMNAGFEAVKEEVEPGRKTVNFWRLTPEAIRNGHIQSTTRYRKLQNQRKAMNSRSRTPQSQPSGAKGGHATRVVKPRHTNSLHSDRTDAHHQQQMTGLNPAIDHFGSMGLPSMYQYLQRPMGDIVGCTMLPPGDTFLDAADQRPTFAMGNGEEWYARGAGPQQGPQLT